MKKIYTTSGNLALKEQVQDDHLILISKASFRQREAFADIADNTIGYMHDTSVQSSVIDVLNGKAASRLLGAADARFAIIGSTVATVAFFVLSFMPLA